MENKISFINLNSFEKTCVLFDENKYSDLTLNKEWEKYCKHKKMDFKENPNLNFIRDYILFNEKTNDYSTDYYTKLFESKKKPKSAKEMIDSSIIKLASYKIDSFIKQSPVYIETIENKEMDLRKKEKEINKKTLDIVEKEKKIEFQQKTLNLFTETLDKLQQEIPQYNMAKLFTGLTEKQKKEVWNNANKNADSLRKANKIQNNKKIDLLENVNTNIKHRGR